MKRCPFYPVCPGACDGWPSCDCAGGTDCPSLCDACRKRNRLIHAALGALLLAFIIALYFGV